MKKKNCRGIKHKSEIEGRIMKGFNCSYDQEKVVFDPRKDVIGSKKNPGKIYEDWSFNR